jgi:hypothetical protein
MTSWCTRCLVKRSLYGRFFSINRPTLYSREGAGGGGTYRPDKLDKWILVHYKHYPSIQTVPRYVDESLMNKAKSKARIKLSNIMMAFFAVSSLAIVIFAKRNMHRDSVVEQGMRRHEAWKKGQEGTTGRLTLLTGAGEEGDK